jgi:thiol-disulfide isomerase/thioredoxin
MSALSRGGRVFAALALMNATLATAAGKLEELTPRAAPTLELTDLGGRSHDLKAHRGKVVLVNFWATWCEPCRDEMPSIQRLRNRLADKRFAVLMVNLDEPEARVRRYIQDAGLDLPVVLDPGKRVTSRWGVKMLPSTFLVAPDGRLRYRLIGDMDWNSQRATAVIDRLLAGK